MSSNPFDARVWALAFTGVCSWTYGECSNDCGIGDTAEGEACLVDLDDDVANGGCNSDPEVFGEIACGEIVCGVVSTYDADTNGDEIPDADYRDTDWYLISQAELATADTDLNGIVRLRATLVSEFPGVTFFITFEPDCDNLGFPGTTGYSGEACSGGEPAEFILAVADHPAGVVAFVSSGNPDGSGIFDGYECATGLNDYTLLVDCPEPPTECAPGPPQGPCHEPNAVPGCEDPACCTLVCEQTGLAFCCAVFWAQACADAAIELGCAQQPGGPVCMATGPSSTVDGYLEVCADGYGAWTSPSYAGEGDRFNPVGAPDDREVAFTSGFFLFKSDTVQRELLATDSLWQSLFAADDSLEREILADTLATDTDGDGIIDALSSVFRVFGAGVDLTFELDQSVVRFVAGDGSVSTALTQTYTITENLGGPVSFELLRVFDGDLTWSGNYGDDSVGTDQASQANAVYTLEHEIPSTRITLSCAEGFGYFGAKQGVDPDGSGPAEPMGAGTDTQEWDAYGIPFGWENYIAGVGYNTNGESGPHPAGCGDPCDAHLGLRIPVTVAGSGQVSITIEHGYGGNVTAGPIGFDSAQEFESDGEPIIHDLADLDGDGDNDVAVVIPLGESIDGKVQLFRNLGVDPGTGAWLGLEKIQNTITVGRDPTGIVLEPFNADQLPDMAVTNAVNGDVWIFRNDGNLEFTLEQMVWTGNRPSAITSGSFNPDGDADIDLAVTNEGDDDVVLLFGTGAGTFVVPPGRAGGIAVGDEPVALLADDFDNNDDDDIAGASRGAAGAGRGGTVWVLRSNGDGTFQPPDYYDIGANPTSLSSGDVNRDKYPDIVTTNASDETVSVLINQGDGTFAPAVSFPVGVNPLSVAAVDLDNDVDHDLAVVAQVPPLPDRLVQVLENLFLGGPGPDFATPINIEVDASANYVVAGDMNNDAYADLVTVNADDGPTLGSVTVLLGSGGAGPEPCPWDCQAVPDGDVGINDFLAMLAQWGSPGACDFDGGGVGVTDFLEFLANFGPCP